MVSQHVFRLIVSVFITIFEKNRDETYYCVFVASRLELEQKLGGIIILTNQPVKYRNS
jgi:hypothetical protein